MEEKKTLCSLLEYACAVLNTSGAEDKAELTLEAYARWHNNDLPIHSGPASCIPLPPLHPARPTHLTTVNPQDAPKRSDHKGNSLQNRLVLIHSLCHIESYAIDLSWDVLVRFVQSTPFTPLEGDDLDKNLVECKINLPRSFFEDWLRIAAEEAKHFRMWRDRLIELGSSYGKLPVHDGLWESATETNHSLLARLAIVHMVHEARGLDVSPKRISQLQSAKDKKSADLLEQIERDEVTHVTSGVTWYKYLCQRLDLDPIPNFHQLVKKHFVGSLKPPFATEARSTAGFTEEWYLPLMSDQDKAELERLNKKAELARAKAQKIAENKARKIAEAKAKAQAASLPKAECDQKANASM